MWITSKEFREKYHITPQHLYQLKKTNKIKTKQKEMQSQTSNWCSYVTEATLFRQKCSDWTFEHLDVFYLVYENILKWNNYIETNYERIICLRNRISTEIWFLLFVWNLSSHPMVFCMGVNRISVLSIKFFQGLKNLQIY